MKNKRGDKEVRYMHEGKHGIMDDLDDMNDLFGSEEDEEDNDEKEDNS